MVYVDILNLVLTFIKELSTWGYKSRTLKDQIRRPQKEILTKNKLYIKKKIYK